MPYIVFVVANIVLNYNLRLFVVLNVRRKDNVNEYEINVKLTASVVQGQAAATTVCITIAASVIYVAHLIVIVMH